MLFAATQPDLQQSKREIHDPAQGFQWKLQTCGTAAYLIMNSQPLVSPAHILLSTYSPATLGMNGTGAGSTPYFVSGE